MTQEERLVRLEKEVFELRESITGNKLRNVVGVMDILETHRRELYGNESTRDMGLKEKQVEDHKRLKSLENDRLKVMAWAAAASAIVMVGWALFKTFVLKH